MPRAVCLLPLKVLNLADNQLTTLPVEIHLVLDNGKVSVCTQHPSVRAIWILGSTDSVAHERDRTHPSNLNGNPFLKLPPRPQQHVSAKEFYGVDLSLEYVDVWGRHRDLGRGRWHRRPRTPRPCRVLLSTARF